MNALITANRQYGPFLNITQGSDRWICDGVEYQFNVIGDASIGEYVPPTVSNEQTSDTTPTKEELLSQLQALQAQIQALE